MARPIKPFSALLERGVVTKSISSWLERYMVNKNSFSMAEKRCSS
jgi:hypothetical protein